jgi:mono/diheme cytochrome c family protein
MSNLVGIAPLVCFIITVLVTADTAQAQQSGNAQQGLRLAREVCAPCHLVVKEAGGSTNPDAPTFEAIARTSGLTSAALTVMLQTPHRNMPNIVIKGDDLKNIIAYILSLKETTDEERPECFIVRDKSGEATVEFRRQLDRLNDRGIVVLRLVDSCRDRPHPQRLGREGPHLCNQALRGLGKAS